MRREKHWEGALEAAWFIRGLEGTWEKYWLFVAMEAVGLPGWLAETRKAVEMPSPWGEAPSDDGSRLFNAAWEALARRLERWAAAEQAKEATLAGQQAVETFLDAMADEDGPDAGE